MTVRINKQKINLREKLTEFEDKVNFDEVVRGLGEYTGNVGIGTTNPAFKLEIQGDEPIIMLKDSSDAYLAYLGDGSSVGDHAQLALYNATDGTNTPTVLLNAGGSAYFNAGNVGIGTTNPLCKFHVRNGDEAPITIDGSTAYESARFTSTAAGRSISLLSSASTVSNYIGSLDQSHNLRFFTTKLSDASRNTHMTITEGGNVGIGTTSPTSKLSIHTSGATAKGLQVRTDDGDADSIRTVGGGGDNDVKFIVKGSGYVGIGTTSPTNTLDIYRNTTSTSDNVFTLRSDVGGSIAQIKFKVTADGSAYTGSTPLTSDNRLKHNERQISEAIQTLGKITPRKYIKTSNLYEANHDFEIDEDGNPVDENGEVVEHRIEAGIIAQEVMDVPELAFAVRDEELDEDGNTVWPYSLDYNSLFTYAIAAIQEQQSIIEDLKSRIETLESK